MNTTTLPVEEDKHVGNVETEYEQYCRAWKRFCVLGPGWILMSISAVIAVGIIWLGVINVEQNIIVAFLCLAVAVVLMIAVIVRENWKIHRRMEALAEMRLRGKTFNF